MNLYLPDIHKEEVAGSLEKLSSDGFYKRNNTFMIGHISAKPKTFQTDFELPFGSCVHLFDTLYDLERNLPSRDLPNLNVPFITNEKNRKFIYHVRTPDITGPITTIDKHRFISRGLKKILDLHQIKNNKIVKPVLDIEDMKDLSSNTLPIVNHNPLNRVFVRGPLSTHRKFMFILTSILNTMHKIPDKNHYLFIPLGDKVYTKDVFLQTKKELTLTSIKDKDSYQYLLMMHWINYIDVTTTNSIFSSIDENLEYNINFVFHTSNKFIMYRLSDIKKLNIKNKTYLKFINQFNTLVLDGMGVSVPLVDSDITDEVIATSTIEDKIDSLYKSVTSANIAERSAVFEESTTLIDNTPEEGTVVNLDPEDAHDEEADLLSDTDDDNDLSEMSRVTTDDEDGNLDDEILGSSDIQEVHTEEITESAPQNRYGDLSEFNIATTSDAANSIVNSYLEDVNNTVNDLIVNDPKLTNKERERISMLAQRFQDIEINDVNIMEILNDNKDPKISSGTVNVLKDYVEDTSMLNSTICNFDNEYMNKTYLKDMLLTAISLNKQGLFLTDIKQDLEFSGTDKLVNYTFSYVDVKGKKHNVKFTVPFIDTDGSCLINGSKMYLKKQMIVLPICKVSEVRVSLSSNYNKTIVERNQAKAHSFINYFKRMIAKISETHEVLYEYQAMSFNEKISYEYSEIAKTYRSFSFSTPEGFSLDLVFNKEISLELFNKYKKYTDRSLDEMQSNHGIFFGSYTSANKKILLFININNVVSAIDLSTRDVANTSIINLLSNIYKTKLSSRLTEWTNIKILDKQLPVGFLLCQQYGFRHMLDYLGVKFTRVNKKLKSATEKLIDYGLDTLESNYYLHITSDDHGKVAEFTPRVPVVGDKVYEDRTTPRICLSESIEGCIVAHPRLCPTSDMCIDHPSRVGMVDAIPNESWSVDMWVYGVKKDNVADKDLRDNTYITKNKLIFDAHVTDEVWLLKTTKLERLGKIRVYCEKGVPIKSIRFKLIHPTMSRQYDRAYVFPHKWLEKNTTDIFTGNERLLDFNISPPKGDFYYHITEHTRGPNIKTLQCSCPRTNGDMEDVRTKRVSLSESIEGCIIGHPNLFSSEVNYNKNIDGHRYQDMKVYGVRKSDIPKEHVVTNRQLVKDKLVFDAHVTDEVWCTVPVQVELIGTIRVFDDNRARKITFNPLVGDLNRKIDTYLFAYTWLRNHVSDKLIDSVVSYESMSSSYKPKADDIVVKFKDCNYYIPRYPLRNSLIMAGMTKYDLSEYLVEDLDTRDAYFKILSDSKLSTNYIKGIDATFKLFVDPITFDVLKQMNEPTNFKDLLIRATDMLTTSKHNAGSSMVNHRMRTFEKINAIVYNEMSRQFSAYTNRNERNPFSLNPKAVILKIVNDQAMTLVDELNPVHGIKTVSGVTYTGAGGRTSASFNENDRLFPDDAVGILSEATPDSSAVGITAQTSLNPNIANTRGMINTDDGNKEPANILSVSGVLMPGSTQDDSKRANFISIQLTHQIATKEASCSRVRTGYERVMAHHSNELYAVTAKQNGKVVLVDDKLKIFKIQYEDGTTMTYEFGTLYGTSSDIVTTQLRELTVKEGDTFSVGEVLAFNPQFFEKDPLERQVDWKHGTTANVAIMDIAGTFEDSTILTKEFGSKLTINPIEVRSITVDRNTIIHQTVDVGDHVEITDPLVVFENADMVVDMSSVAKTDEALDYINKLNRRIPKAKFAGVITKIELYMCCDKEDLHPTLQVLHDKLTKEGRLKYKQAKGSSNYHNFIPITQVTKGTKIKGTLFNNDTVVIKYYISESIVAGVGDKVVVDSSLKSIISKTLNYNPTSESGVAIDLLFSGSSISNRIVNSPIIVGVTERILEKLEKDILEIYFNGE